MTDSIAVAEKPMSLQSMLEKSKGQIALALPKHMTPERMIRVALTAVQKTPMLQKCAPRSIVGCLVQASQLGLEPDGVLGQAYMVPFFNSKTGAHEAQLQIGYRGFIALARRSGEVSTIYSEPVYECDKFRVELGTAHKLIHVPNYDEPTRGEKDKDGALIGLKGAYAVVVYKDQTQDFEYMSAIQLARIRASSKAANNGPWVTHTEEMIRKCPIRRLAKRLPLSPEFMNAGVIDEYVDQGMMASETTSLPGEDLRLAGKSTEALASLKLRYSRQQQEESGRPTPAAAPPDPDPFLENPLTPEQVEVRRQELAKQAEQLKAREYVPPPQEATGQSLLGMEDAIRYGEADEVGPAYTAMAEPDAAEEAPALPEPSQPLVSPEVDFNWSSQRRGKMRK